MLHGIWNLARAALRLDSRRISPHLARFVLTVLLLIAVVEARSDSTAAPGLRIFQYQLLFSTIYLTVVATFGFSQVVSEEKEHGTLDLLNLAGVNSIAVVLGKLLPRFWDTLLLLAVQFPFALLSVTLGGVSWPQVESAFITLAAYLWLIAGIGVYASAKRQTGSGAVATSSLLIIPYTLPMILTHLSGLWPGLRWVSDWLSLHVQLAATTTSGYAASPWTPAVWLALGLGVALFALACLALSQPTETTGGVVLNLFQRLRRPPQRRVRQRPWSRPLIWRDFHYGAGGRKGILLRLTVHGTILVWMIAVHRDAGHAFVWAALVGGIYSVLDGTWTASRLFSEEVRNQTWSTLVQTPHSIAAIAYDKSLGWALALSPSILIPYLFICLTILVHPNATSFWMRAELVVGSVVTGVAVFAYLHLLALLSLDWSWKAIPPTFCGVCGSAFCFIAMIFPWRSDISARCGWFVVTGLLLLGVIYALQRVLLRRLNTLVEVA